MNFLKQAALSIGTLVVAGTLFVLLQNHAVAFALTIGVAAISVPILWILVSAMRPALPDRTCPGCHAETLRLLTPGVREGVRCPACGFTDAALYVPYLIDVDDALDAEDAARTANRGEIQVQRAVEAGGGFTTLRTNGTQVTDLVCASKSDEKGFCGVSFKVNHCEGRWYLSTWAPHFYLVPEGRDCATVCLTVLRAGTDAAQRLPPDVVQALGLIEIPDADLPRELRSR